MRLTDGSTLDTDANRRFYDPLWARARLVEPHRFNTWPIVTSLLSTAPRLEIGPGLRPRLPLAGTYFVDLSPPAVAKLRAQSATALLGLASALPFDAATFGLVCALDIIEHVDDEDSVWSELSRVAAPGAALLLSAPLHPSRWTSFDDFVGHRRRYEPEQLLAKLARYGFSVEQSAVYGMRPKNSRLVNKGMWYLEHRRERAMWWYNHVFMPLGVYFQKKLVLMPGMLDANAVDEVLLVCRKQNGTATAQV